MLFSSRSLFFPKTLVLGSTLLGMLSDLRFIKSISLTKVCVVYSTLLGGFYVALWKCSFFFSRISWLQE